MLLSIANRALRSGLYRGARLYRSLNPSRGAQELPAIPAVLLNTLPKSGSVFLFRTLSESLQCGRMHVGNMYSLVDQISPEKMRLFANGGFVSQNHLAPSIENLQILRHFGCRMVLHVRDPRQALVSWVHHIDRVYRQDGSTALLLLAPRPPSIYFSWDFMQKLDWQIDHYLPLTIDWLVRWLAVYDDSRLAILLTTYDELSRDIVGLCRRVCDFYKIPADRFRFREIPKTMDNHFRLADDGEWLRVLSAAQIERADAMMPPGLALRFAWRQPPYERRARNLAAAVAGSPTHALAL
jgi:hypothetical protein